MELAKQGLTSSEIARRCRVPRSTVRDWRAQALPATDCRQGRCRDCGHAEHRHDEHPAAYAYLLGVYLGDGHITEHRRGVHRLRISLDSLYPGIVSETAGAIRAVLPLCAVHIAGNVGGARLAVVSAYSKQWPCLVPQHGLGPKHMRRIELTSWQATLVERHPTLLLRGLIHSDGCRSLNTVTARGAQYAYWRYTFTNASNDIRRIFCDACDMLGIPWRRMNPRTISVARRSGVEMLDGFVGPKY